MRLHHLLGVSLLLLLGAASASHEEVEENDQQTSGKEPASLAVVMEEAVPAMEQAPSIPVDAVPAALECHDPNPIRKSYTQDNAPQDIKEALQEITKLVNKRFQEVLKVELKYLGGAIHRAVGLHRVVTSVTLLDNGKRATRCVVVELDIHDVNECLLPKGHPMHHRCHPTARCYNTVGAYGCSCPNDEPAVADAGNGMCGGKHNTTECCDVHFPRGERLERCRADFRCYTNPCPADCVDLAICEASLGRYKCTCKGGLVGNGHRCKSPQPAALVDQKGRPLVDTSLACGCQAPMVDHCHGVQCGPHASCRRLATTHECVCDDGFKLVESLGCVDETLPTLKLVGANPLVLRQCDPYVEPGLDIVDQNSEDYARSLEVDYSQPLGQCLMHMGTFHVDYTVQTNWTDPKNVSVRREVVVLDVNECELPRDVILRCPECEPRCVPEARCENLEGTYTCKCPPCTDGDGFRPHLFRAGNVPKGYVGGTGCRDVCPPKLQLRGSDKKVFRVCKCTGLLGGDDDTPPRDFDTELRELVRRSGGKELCDPPDWPCIRATDQTGAGVVDLTDRVSVGVPYKVGPNLWKVPYAVVDDAGNEAVPVERDVVVLELTLEEYARSLALDGAAAAKAKAPPAAECPKCPEEPPPPKPGAPGACVGSALDRRGGGSGSSSGASRRRGGRGPIGAGTTEELGAAGGEAEADANSCPSCPSCPLCPPPDVLLEQSCPRGGGPGGGGGAAGTAEQAGGGDMFLMPGFPVHVVLVWLVLAVLMLLVVLATTVLWQWLVPREPMAPPMGPGGGTPYRGIVQRDYAGAGTPGSVASATGSAVASSAWRNNVAAFPRQGDRTPITPARLTRATPLTLRPTPDSGLGRG